MRACCSASASSRGVLEYQLPAPSTGPIPCHTRIPAASSRSSRAGSSGCWERTAFAPIALQLAHERVLVARRQCVAVSARVLLDRGAVQQQPLAVEVDAPADSRSAGAGRPEPRSCSRCPRPVRACRGWDCAATTAPVPGRSRWSCRSPSDRGRASGRGSSAGCVWPPCTSEPSGGSSAVGPSLRTSTLTVTTACCGVRAHPAGASSGRSVRQLAFADRAHVHLAVQPAPVEPGAVKAFFGLPPGVPPVDAHDHRVRAGGERGAHFKRQVGAPVRAELRARRPTRSPGSSPTGSSARTRPARAPGSSSDTTRPSLHS